MIPAKWYKVYAYISAYMLVFYSLLARHGLKQIVLQIRSQQITLLISLLEQFKKKKKKKEMALNWEKLPC